MTAPRPVSAAGCCSSARYDDRTSGPEKTEPKPSASPCSRNQRNSSGCTQRSIVACFARRLQVLADRDDVDAVRAEVAHRLDDLVVRLAEADDDPGLRQHRVVGDLLRAPRAARAPCRSSPSRRASARCRRRTVSMLWLKTSGRAASTVCERLLLDAEEVGREHLDRSRPAASLQRADRRRVVAGAAVGDVVAVDGGDDDVRSPICAAACGEAERLERVGRRVGLARSARSSSGTRACTCRRGSGTSRCRGPSTRRCSGSVPPRRSCAALRRGSAS